MEARLEVIQIQTSTTETLQRDSYEVLSFFIHGFREAEFQIRLPT